MIHVQLVLRVPSLINYRDSHFPKKCLNHLKAEGVSPFGRSMRHDGDLSGPIPIAQRDVWFHYAYHLGRQFQRWIEREEESLLAEEEFLPPYRKYP